ncbi:MAG: response regulator [Reichenbachiella sp.]|uniref:response regulator n=1 Tax=Reichenbachiella sp. TaxID=2184521 RepID=UPI0032651384
MNTTVLYVDDEDIPRLIFEKSFESKYSILVAGSGQEALDKIAELEDEFIVVISDMRMPEMNGLEFIIEARDQYKNMACFILTSLDQDDELEQAINDNLIEKVFNKPLNVAEIDEAIKEVTTGVA